MYGFQDYKIYYENHGMVCFLKILLGLYNPEIQQMILGWWDLYPVIPGGQDWIVWL